MRIPYGYKLVDGEITTDDERAEVVRSIFAYYLAGASLGKVVERTLRERYPLSDRKVQMDQSSSGQTS